MNLLSKQAGRWKQWVVATALINGLVGCSNQMNDHMQLYETSAAGDKLQPKTLKPDAEPTVTIQILPDERYQQITGFGGSFTQASAYLLNRMGAANRKKILEAYFADSGARYSLTRTHINSCDFSTHQYAYGNVPGDTLLQQFSLDSSKGDLIPMIKEAKAVSSDGFRIIASPWTAPPWMKDNNDWRGGKLLPKYYPVWARYFSKYLAAMQQEGIPIWGLTVENEPLGNNNNWESMHFTAAEMTDFVRQHLGPQLQRDGWDSIKILGYDQNRGNELKDWVDVMYADEASSKYYDGTAVHWYASTYDVFPENLQYAHKKAPTKHLIQTEGCIDGDVPAWKDDQWYWKPNATDWGYDWATPEDKHLHPPYEPAFRYARDIIGCLNNWVDGWVDWNMVLDRQGGPNWFKNWCGAPVIVDPTADEVYFTPLYYVMSHFSKFIRPGAVRIGWQHQDKDLMVTAAQNPDGSIAIVLFNPTPEAKPLRLNLAEKSANFTIAAKAIQTVLITEY